MDANLIKLLPHLKTRAMRLARHREDAEDLLHDTIVRMLEHHASFQPGTNYQAWAGRIMFNLFRDRRRIQRRAFITTRSELPEVAVDPVADDRVFLAEVERALLLLSNNHRQLLVMALADMPYEESARLLGCPMTTVRSGLARARVFLKKALELGKSPYRRGYLTGWGRGKVRDA